MSNESSASETTPLRRPDSQLSEDVNVSPLGTRNASINHLNLTTPTITTNHQQQQHITATTTGTRNNATLVPTTAIISANHNHNSNNNHNNHNSINNIEVRLGNIYSENFNSNINNNNNSNNNNNHHLNIQNSNSNTNSNINRRSSIDLQFIKMDTNKRILCRVGLDVLILLCVGFPILCFYLWGSAYERGFFCDDESLKHPFKESTVRNWMLYIIGLVIPVSVILVVELIISNKNARISNGNNTTARRYVFMDYEIPDWLIECYKKIGVFVFGAGVGQLTTDIAKYSIGRLRPHFFAVCQPIMADGTTCSDPSNFGKYIQDFRCLGDNSSKRMLKEVRLSFPSGHSSFTFYTMVYLALYLQSRMTWRGSKLLRHFLQFLFIMTAWYTALSRVSDYKHHWSDVLAGSAIGSLCAVIVANYISDLFESKSTKSYLLPRTNQDTNLATSPTTANGNR